MSFKSAVYIVFEQILKLLIPVLIILMILIVIKIIIGYYKYGKTEFLVFKKRDSVKLSDMVINIIKKIDSDSKIIFNDNLYADIVLISKTGLYLIKMHNFKGIVSGNRKDQFLNDKIKNDNTLISNPFYKLDLDKKKVLNKKNNINVYTILITNNNSSVNINNVDKEEIISLQNLYYTFERYLKNENIQCEIIDEELINKISNI